MPFYTYECKACSKVFDRLQSGYDETKHNLKCEFCGKKKLIRYIGKSSLMITHDAPATSTPVNFDKDGSKMIARIPHYADSKTGKNLGFGRPETITI